MTTYRIYFRAYDRISGREDFEADSDLNAIRIARLLYESCADVCNGFELWQGQRLIRTRQPPYDGLSLTDLNDAHQAVVIGTEELIRQSTWSISRSTRLLERLASLQPMLAAAGS